MAAEYQRRKASAVMRLWLERIGIRIVSTAIAVVFWPLKVLAKLADALSYIDPKLEGI